MKGKTLLALLLLAGFLQGSGPVRRFGTGARVSAFGIPNALLDLVFYEHPQLTGTAFSFELHSYGDKGPRSVFSGVYCLEYSRMTGAGYFRVENSDNRLLGSGEMTQVNATATILMHIFPGSPVHPYIGGGIGIGRMSVWAEGAYQDALGTTIRDSYRRNVFVPVGHLPIGVVGNFGDRVLARVEAGFKNGFYVGGSLVVNF